MQESSTALPQHGQYVTTVTVPVNAGAPITAFQAGTHEVSSQAGAVHPSAHYDSANSNNNAPHLGNSEQTQRSVLALKSKPSSYPREVNETYSRAVLDGLRAYTNDKQMWK